MKIKEKIEYLKKKNTKKKIQKKNKNKNKTVYQEL